MKKWVVVLLHCVCWLAILTNNIYDTSSTSSQYVKDSIVSSGLPAWWFFLVFNSCYWVVSLTGFYGFYFAAGPLLLQKKKYLTGSIAIVIILSLMVGIRYVGEFYVQVPYLKFHNYFWKTPGAWYYIKNCVVYHFNYCL